MTNKTRISRRSYTGILVMLTVSAISLWLSAFKIREFEIRNEGIPFQAGELVVVKGRITDVEGNAISGALIRIKDTSKTSKSDVAGVFEISDVPLKRVIVVSHPKFSGQELKISKPKP